MAGEVLEFVRGDTHRFTITCTRPDADGEQQLIDLTNAHIWCTIKDQYADTDAEALLQVETPYNPPRGINILNQTTHKGQAQVIIGAGETSGADLEHGYKFDVQVLEADDTVSTPVDGLVHFKADVTIAVSPGS